MIIQFEQVPLGNIELDWRIHTAYIFFARPLCDKKQVTSGPLIYSNTISWLLEAEKRVGWVITQKMGFKV